MPCAILTYHSQIITANEYGGNDHLTLARDLELLTRAGCRVEPLRRVVDALAGDHGLPGERLVVITFDDGALLDFHDVDHPTCGTQRGFRNILRDFRERHGADAQPGLHASSFVIASPEARRLMDERSLFGLGWMGDDWWSEAVADPLMAIESHGWDHNHPDVDPDDPRRGRFDTIDDEAGCLLQVVEAGRTIEALGGGRPRCFAYPFGQSSAYLREAFLPNRMDLHGLSAAVGTEPGYVTAASDRWNLPRFVAGRDWKTEAEFEALLAGIEPG